MNKFVLSVALGILLIASAILNILQYNQNSQAKMLNEKLAFFENRFGTYEILLESQKQADAAKEKRDHTITTYIKTGISEPQILALKSVLESQSSVQSVEYVSAAQALENFKTRNQDDKLTLQALNELKRNPLGAILTITITDPSQKQSLANVIESNGETIIDQVQY